MKYNVKLGHATPRLRSFDEEKAREFYVDFLGFTVTYEHRFAESFPLYMQVKRDGCIIILSEHHGDASPGASLLITVDDIMALRDELNSKGYKNWKAEVVETEWDSYEMGIKDPFGNTLTFQQHKPENSDAVVEV